MKIAQGAGSDAFKFTTKICNKCNSSTTQDSDLAYTEFIDKLENNGASLQAFNELFEFTDFVPGSPKYLSIARYFAKLLGNHIADADFPIPNKLRNFVLKTTEFCSLHYFGAPIDFGAHGIEDQQLDPVSRLSHGGLIVIVAEGEDTPCRFHSCRVIGNFQIVFQYEFDIDERKELFELHSDFCKKFSAAGERDWTTKKSPKAWGNLGIFRDDGQD
jgi:hypothetical protein